MREMCKQCYGKEILHQVKVFDNFSLDESWQASLSLGKVLSGFCRVEAGVTILAVC